MTVRYAVGMRLCPPCSATHPWTGVVAPWAAVLAVGCGAAEYPGLNPALGPTDGVTAGSDAAGDSTGVGGREAPNRTDPSAGSGAGSADGPVEDDAGAQRQLLFAVVGDYGVDSKDAADVAALVRSWAPDHVFTVGDNNYPIGAASTIDDHIGQYYSHFIGEYQGDYGSGAAVNRFWPSPGNHDWGTPDLQPYLDYFTLPGNERYYDVDLGLVHLFAIDSDPHEPDGTLADSTQAHWLRHALAQSTACWNFVYFHHPAYSSGSHGSETDMQWPFEAWGADAVFAGHDHTYERLQVGGIPYFVVGLGGAGRYSFPNVVPESIVRYNEHHGALSISISSTDMSFEFFAVDGDGGGELVDVHTIEKTCDR